MGIVLSSCINNKPTTSKTLESSIPVVKLTEQDIVMSKEYVADIQAIKNVEIRSKISGFLDDILVDEGAFVKKGELLFILNDQEYRADVAKARAAMNSIIAETRTVALEVEKVKILVNKKIVSTAELDVAKAKLHAIEARVEEAKAALHYAETKLAYTRVKAPYDGIIDRIPLKVGSLLDEGTLITSVSDISSVFIYFNISENEYLEYLRQKPHLKNHEENEVQLILADGKTYEHFGKIETVVSEFEGNTGSIAFRAKFPNPESLLKHGASGKVSLSNELEDALLLPQKSVFEIQDKNYVFILDASNKVKMRHFEPKARIDDYYVVATGIQKGEAIVYEGIQNIKDGMAIIPKFIQLDSSKITSLL